MGFYTEVTDCRIKVYAKDVKKQYLSITNHKFIFISEGKLEFEKDGEKIAVQENDLVFFPPETSYSFTVLSETCRIISIAFDFFIPQVNAPEIMMDQIRVIYNKAVAVLKTVTKINKLGTTYLILQQIAREREQQQCHYITVIRNLLPELIINLFRAEGILSSPLEHINSVAIWAGPEERFKLEAGTEIKISNIEFRSGGLDDKSEYSDSDENGELLGVINPEHCYVEEERSMGAVKCYTDPEESYHSQSAQIISTDRSTNFKVWFFLARNINAMNLRPFVNTGFVTFAVKSNKPFRCLFSMYHRATYTCISSVLSVSEVDKWQEIKIRFSSDTGKCFYSNYVDTILTYIRENYMNKISLTVLAEYVHIEKAYMCTIFKNHMKMSIGEYIRLFRVNIAKNLLLETSYKIEDIAINVGFYDIHHFSRVFKQVVGINPSEYRNRNYLL